MVPATAGRVPGRPRRPLMPPLAPTSPEVRAGTHRILVVDDEEPVRALLTRFAESLGCQVFTAGDALNAVRVLRVTRVDLVLVDMWMPGPDGAWLIEQIHAQWPTLPILIATGVPELDPHVTLRPGVVGYILKPFDFAELEEALERVLGGKAGR